ncbi:MAG: transglutaminase family protein [Candidatus Dormibacteria bacterium]
MLGVQPRLRPASTSLPALSSSLAVGLLALGVIGCTGWAVLAAGWVVGGGPAVLVGLVAVAEAALLSRARVGRGLALLAAPALGAAVIVPLTIGGMPATAPGFWPAARAFAAAAVAGLSTTTDWTFLVGLCAVLWLVGCWLGWVAVDERRGVLAVLPCIGVLMPNAIAGGDPGQIGLPTALAVGFAILLIARVELLRRALGWQRRRVPQLPGTERRYWRTAAVAALAVTGVGSLAPAASSRDFTNALLASIGGGHGSGNGGHNGAPRPRPRREGPPAIGFSPLVSPGGPLVDRPVPVLRYILGGGGTSYLRVTVEGVFSGGDWLPSASAAGDTTVGAAPGPLPRDRDPSDGGIGRHVARQDVQVLLSSAGATGDANLAVFPGDPEASDQRATVLGPAGGSDLLSVDEVRIAPAGQERTVGLVSTASEAQLRAAGTAYPVAVSTSDLELGGPAEAGSGPSPDNQIATLRSIAAQWTAGTTNPYDAARAIERHLRSAPFTYTLKPKPAPPGTWPIVDFLTRTHAGYCQYYASAMGALLRADGIPARLVSGYGPGSSSTGVTEQRGTVHQVTSTDAHVWVEAYFPGEAWIPFEPTPSSDVGDYQPFGRGSAAPPPPPSEPTPHATPAPAPTPRPTVAPPPTVVDALTPAVPAPVAWSLLGLLLAAAAAGLALRWLATPRTPQAVWRRLEWLARPLCPPRRRSETHAAYAARLAAALPADSVTVLHRDGSGLPGPRPVRARAREALSLLATTTGKASFAPAQLEVKERIGWRRTWVRLLRLWPALLYRGLLARSA